MEDQAFFIDNVEDNTCFCDGNSEYYIVTEGDDIPKDESTIVIQDGTLHLTYVNFDKRSFYETSFPIKYCPVCGRKLN